jgi:hypothetical protein
MLRSAIGFVVSTPCGPVEPEELEPDALGPEELEPDVLEPDVLEPDELDGLEVWTELEVVVVVGPWLVELPPVASVTTWDVHDAEATSGKVRLRRMARRCSCEAADGTIDMALLLAPLYARSRRRGRGPSAYTCELRAFLMLSVLRAPFGGPCRATRVRRAARWRPRGGS